MDFNDQNLLSKEQDNSIGVAEDWISKLPDSLLHYILSFLETNLIAQTSVLSKRWNHIWTSIPALDFQFWSMHKPPLLPEVNKFMDFVDRTMRNHDSSNIQKFSLSMNININASWVHSWMEELARHNVEELSLFLRQDEPLYIPLSLHTCESLVKLKLSASRTIHVPKSLSFPKLKSLILRGIQFTDGDCWNGQHFSNYPVLENLILDDCSWVGMRKFCILTPALKVLEIADQFLKGDGLQDCDLKVYAPSLVSLTYMECVAKDYDLSRFVTLDNAVVYFNKYHARREQWIGYDGAAVTKFFRALSHVQCLGIDAASQEALLLADDFVNNLPTFHNLNQLDLTLGRATDKLIFALLKAAPNLKSTSLRFKFYLMSYDDEREYDESGDSLRHLQFVRFLEFSGKPRELRWAKLILKNAKSLQTMTIRVCAENKEVVISELTSVPRASGRCVIEFI